MEKKENFLFILENREYILRNSSDFAQKLGPCKISHGRFLFYKVNRVSDNGKKYCGSDIRRNNVTFWCLLQEQWKILSSNMWKLQCLVDMTVLRIKRQWNWSKLSEAWYAIILRRSSRFQFVGYFTLEQKIEAAKSLSNSNLIREIITKVMIGLRKQSLTPLYWLMLVYSV